MWDKVSAINANVRKARDEKFVAGEDDVVSVGPAGRPRRCTDPCWIPIFIAAQLVWVVVTCMGMVDGNPEKLYLPRDFQGAYCGVGKNWNDGPNTADAPKASHTMNLTSTVDGIFNQFVCSSAVRGVLIDGNPDLNIAPLITNQSQIDDYLCDCCLKPCGRCSGASFNGGDLTSVQQVENVISERLNELAGRTGNPADLFDPAKSANNLAFSSADFWKKASQNFNTVCLPSCDPHASTLQDNSSADHQPREYKYAPARDSPLYTEWDLISNAQSNSMVDGLKRVIDASFTFKALPEAVCPYAAAYCVPMPGVNFKEIYPGSDLCTFHLSQQVVNVVGNAASHLFTSLGGDSLISGARQQAGDFAGDFEKTVDTFIIVAFLSFIVGIVFLIFLRLFIGSCVWIAVLVSIACFACGGVFCMIRSQQCQGDGFFDSGHHVTVALVKTVESSAEHAVNVDDDVSESLSGNGADYRGAQSTTIGGKTCAAWATQTVDPAYRSANYPNSGLVQNYCRNPYKPGDRKPATTIWCFTEDPTMTWEECSPIGTLMPECRHGYAIASESNRNFIWYAGWLIWGLGLVWIIVIICLRDRIRLAIALNKVAARFLAHNPHVLSVPILQTITAVIWTLGWLLLACFLLSQVPDNYTPTGYFATYEEAYGTTSSCAFWEFGDKCAAQPGACNSKWPQGEVWKTDECQIDGDDVKCWRCYPPRFMMDWRFGVSFFVFLWNNAFIVALGQIVIAMATAIWFFESPSEKGKQTILPAATRLVFRNHLGSVMFGSFIVALVRFVKYLMQYLEKQAAAQKNRVVVLLLKALQCCIWCFEKCIQFLNKNAYIQIALHGKPFCTSAKQAFFLIMRNAARFGTVSILSGIIHTIGYTCIMSGTMVSGYFIVREMHRDVSPTLPVVTYGVLGYIAAKLFMNVFGLAVDTSLQCFLVAEELGKIGDFVPKSLQRWIDKNVDHKTVEESSSEEEK